MKKLFVSTRKGTGFSARTCAVILIKILIWMFYMFDFSVPEKLPRPGGRSVASWMQLCARWLLSAALFHLVWENSWHLATLPLVSPRNDIWEKSAEIPYWWRVTTQIWVESKFWLVESNFPRSTTNQKHYPDVGSNVTCHQYGISELFSQTSFGGETSGIASPNVGCFLRLFFIQGKTSVVLGENKTAERQAFMNTPTHTIAGVQKLYQQLLPTKVYYNKKNKITSHWWKMPPMRGFPWECEAHSIWL